MSIQASFAYGFQYGQCLLNGAKSYNNELRGYKNVAYVKAAIKKIALEKNAELLKWNYETTRLIYDLIILQPELIRLNNVYKIIRERNPKRISEIQNFFDDAGTHLALAQIDDAENEKLDQQNGVTELISDFEQATGGDARVAADIAALKKSFETDEIKDALGDLYDRIQEASVGASPVEPDSIEQWIALATEFQASLVPKACSNASYVSKEKIANKCENYKLADNKFKTVISGWERNMEFPDEEEFLPLLKELPPLQYIKFPELKATDSSASKVLEYHYVRTIEDFLFSRNNIALEHVQNWIKTEPKHTVMVKQANAEGFKEKDSASTIFRYIVSKERVLGNAFDHFVWKGQEGTPQEKTIDGIARTLYGEVESCQIAGANQFEAIASIIAARSISIDRQNTKNKKFWAILNLDLKNINSFSGTENVLLDSHQRGAADFGRYFEMETFPIISEMPTPARVVSRPGQFSVWKIGDDKKFDARTWIDFPWYLRYPKLEIIISGPIGADVDSAQRKTLCPNNAVFDQAVKVAEELMNDYHAYANKYRFYSEGKRVVPYFYTHGAITLNFAKQITPKPKLVKLDKNEKENLPLYKGPLTCPNFKLYQPKVFKVSKKPIVKKKKLSKKRSRR